ncbi:MAG: anthranilate synthase component I [Acidobacteriota bacterium]|nr:anthranilate synthase component I [Acidobacteriota bacterium]
MSLETICPQPVDIITISKEFRMDCETPVSLYLKLAREKPYSFILESVDHGQHSGRYSFVGWDPILHFTFSPPKIKVEGAIQGEFETDHPLESLKKLLTKINMLDEQTTPAAMGGLVGHIGYDAIRMVEDIGPYEPYETPWVDMMLPCCLLVMDHLNHVVTVLCHQPVRQSQELARKEAERIMHGVLDKMRLFSVSTDTVPIPDLEVDLSQWESNLSKEEFCDMVLRAKQHILDGDIFQVVLSRAVRRPFYGDPFDVYRIIRQINPSPYMFFLKQNERYIVGGSPEALVTLHDGLMSTRPIAGTRPRGADLEEDIALEKGLLADQKEVAEHVMLVDLGRNDLGRVAETGTVTVPRFMQIERYSHVMHIVSVVRARLRRDLHALDAMMSVFPAGTLSGAPKIRAMQIINDFEPETRRVYGGAIGFIDFAGNMDSCIAIRTAIVEDHVVRIQAGAGIVADSVPENEYDETTHKMMSMISAVERAIWQSEHL